MPWFHAETAPIALERTMPDRVETRAPSRIGFAVKVLGKPNLKSNDARKWRSGPHLRVSIGYLREVFAYLEKSDIRMYRMSSDVAPYVTHPDLPQFHNQVRECQSELADLGKMARAQGLRLSFHPSQFVIMNSPDDALNDKGIADLAAQAEILDRMELGPEAVLVIHVGGTYGDRVSGRARWASTYRRLPEPARRRLVLENDDVRYSAADVLLIHEEVGVPLVFDNQHFWCNNPERLDLAETIRRFLATWPAGVRPKMHFSSMRTEMRQLPRKDRKTGKLKTVLQPPIWTGHADFAHPFEFVAVMHAAAGQDFDVMLEAKAKDLALLRLRRDLPTQAPEVAARFGWEHPEELPEPEEIAIEAPPAWGTIDRNGPTQNDGAWQAISERPPTHVTSGWEIADLAKWRHAGLRPDPIATEVGRINPWGSPARASGASRAGSSRRACRCGRRRRTRSGSRTF